jgi:thiol-disulfide isomerase/thioredoxin
MRTYVLTRVVAVCAALLVAGCTTSGLGDPAPGGKPDPQPVSEWKVGDRGKPIALSGDLLETGSLDLASLRGSVVVVNVWGSWCGPCRAEAPALVAAYNQVSSKGVKFVGIDSRDTSAAAKQFVSNNGETWPSLVDKNGTLLLPFKGKANLNSLPATFVLDRTGRVSARVLGAVRTDTLTALVDTALKDPTS